MRMGNDKGLITLQSSATWAQHLMVVISSACNTPVVSVNEEQYLSYLNVFSASAIITDNNSVLANGPLKGILSVHLQYPSEDLLVLACDMIDMKKEVLNFLQEQYKKNSDAEIVVYKNEDQTEPLCGIYSSRALNQLLELLKKNKLSKHSMMHALEQVTTCYISLPHQWKSSFKNYNTPGDLHNV